MKKKLGLLLVVLLLISTFSATSVAAEKMRDQIIIGTGADITSLDHQLNNDISTGFYTRSVFETLVKLNPETGEFENWLAEDITNEDDVTIKVKLREDIEFSNGTPLTAEDVKFTLDRQKNHGKVSHLILMIKEVEIVDDLNLIIHLNEPSSALVTSLAHPGCSIICKSVVEPIDEAGDEVNEPSDSVGTGPYKITGWVLGSEFTLEKNENYWNKDAAAVTPKLVFKVIPEDTSRTVALETGEIDVLLDVPTISVNEIKDNPDLKILDFTSTLLQGVVFNTSKPPFDNKALREAVAHCMNREAMIQVQFDGHAEINYSCIGLAAIGYTPDVKHYEYDLELAKEKLAEGGKPDGFSFSVLVRESSQAKGMQVLQAACAEVGIQMDIQQVEPALYFDMTGKGLHEACHLGWTANAEPDNTFRPFFSKETVDAGGANRSKHWSPEIEELLEKASTTYDYDEKVELYQEISKLAMEDCVTVGYCSPTGFVAMRKEVDGFIVSSIQNHEFYQLKYVEP